MRQKRRRRGASKAAGKRIGPQGIILFILYSLKRAKNTGLISSAQRSKRATIRQNRVGVARAGCPLWVKSGHFSAYAQCLLYPRRRTSELGLGMSALCQKQTFCAAVNNALFDHLVGELLEMQWHINTDCFRRLEIDQQFEFCRLLDC